MFELKPQTRVAPGWQAYLDRLHGVLAQLAVTDRFGNRLDREAGFRTWKDWALDVRARRGSLFFVGNGASASMASHISADVGKGAQVRTQVFTDVSLMTAVANDLAYEDVFAEPLSWSMRAGDLLVAISSSGCSPNVVRAVEVAHQRGGKAVTLSAMREGNDLRGAGSLNFWVPGDTYGLAETSHAAVLHHWVDELLESLA